MIVVRREKEPNSLLQFRKQYPDADYETDIPTNVLKDIREQMWEEQRHLCAYCMRKLTAQLWKELSIADQDIRKMKWSMIRRQL